MKRVIERLYACSHLLNEAGPGPSYLDPGSGGPDNDFTGRNATFMTWNLMHLARMLKDAGGIPAHGNQRSQWDAGCRFDFPNPEYRWRARSERRADRRESRPGQRPARGRGHQGGCTVRAARWGGRIRNPFPA